MSYTGLPNNAQYDYLIYKDVLDSDKIKARNGKTAQIEFNHATDFGNVYNSCINALPATGGLILIQAGTFETATTCTFKNYASIKGAGINTTIIKLANSANKDVFATPNFDAMIAARPANGYFDEASVVHDVTFEGLTIDGNKANNGTGRYGLAKIAYGWQMKDIMVENCKSDGIYTEWGTVAGCPGTPSPTMRCMEDYWYTVYIHHCDGRGLTMRGPHDSNFVNLMVWGCVGNSCAFEASGTAYSGGCQVQGYHCFAQINSGTTATYCTANATFVNVAIEGGLGSGGIGLHITGSARVRVIGGSIFANDTGVKIDGGVGYSMIDCEFHSNTYGIKLFGVQCKVSGFFHDNISTDIVMGDTGVACGYNDVRAKCTRTPLALNWAHTANANNYVDLSVVILPGHAVISGTPRMEDNHVSIWSIDSSNNRVPANAGRYVPYPSHMPSYKKYGVFFAGSQNAGEGIFHGLFVALPSAGPNVTHPTAADDDGKFIRYTTAATTGSVAGIRLPYPISKQAWRPTMRVRFRIENTDCRVFLGWKGNSGTDPNGDDVLNGEVGLYFGKQASSSSWQVLRNDGTGATVASNVTGNPAPNTSWHVVDFWADGTGWGLRLDGGADIHFTTEIPSTSHYMAVLFAIQATSNAARYLDLHYVELSQDK